MNGESQEYRIGEFSKILGVTPDLLKHYTKHGILNSHSNGQNNYHYYYFYQSGDIWTTKEYQAYGFSLKEISYLINKATAVEIATALDGNIKALQKRLYLQRLYEESAEHKLSIARQIAEGTFSDNWMINMREESWFLPISNRFCFDLANLDHINEWEQYRPLVQNAAHLIRKDDNEYEIQYGFIIAASKACQIGLKYESPVISIPSGRYLTYQTSEPRWPQTMTALLPKLLNKPLAFMHEHGFELQGNDIFIEMPMTTWEDGVNYMHRFIYLRI